MTSEIKLIALLKRVLKSKIKNHFKVDYQININGLVKCCSSSLNSSVVLMAENADTREDLSLPAGELGDKVNTLNSTVYDVILPQTIPNSSSNHSNEFGFISYLVEFTNTV